jgi:two-component system cell cycle response regulator DivK
MKRILVVEDNEKNMYLVCFILKDNKYDTIKAASGEEGVELAIKEKPDLILMDIQLPGIDGLEATKRIRETESGRKVPIIAITSYAMSGDRKKLLEGGCTGYIEKPINLDVLLSEIKKYI